MHFIKGWLFALFYSYVETVYARSTWSGQRPPIIKGAVTRSRLTFEFLNDYSRSRLIGAEITITFIKTILTFFMLAIGCLIAF